MCHSQKLFWIFSLYKVHIDFFFAVLSSLFWLIDQRVLQEFKPSIQNKSLKMNNSDMTLG